ncbi:MAG TPA: V-type ATP synthase subunit E family protein [Coriobacteriia bacterium]
MAIDDIVTRIAGDAQDESGALLAAARADAERTTSEARARADARAAASLVRARADADREETTLLANARLAARDAMLSARRALDDEALARVEEALLSLDDERYVTLLAREIVVSAEGCTSLRLGSADPDRLRRTLPAALKAVGVTLAIDEAPADVERGVVLEGDRLRVEVSAAAIVASRRDALLADADALLFKEGKQA